MIENYLAYLRDISRKIVSDSGFEKALLDKSRLNKSFCFEKEDDDLTFDEFDDGYLKIKHIEDYLSKNNDKRFFCGFGMVAGTHYRQYAAPLIYVECQIIKEDETYTIEFDFASNSFNYDLLTSVLNSSSTVNFSLMEDEGFNEDFRKEVDLVEKIEGEIKVYDEISLLEEYSNEVFSLLTSKLKAFKEIGIYGRDYDFETEQTLFKSRPPKNRKGKVKTADKRIRKSIFEQELSFVVGAHFFVNSIPHQLSTYQALQRLIKETSINKFQNQILEKMLTNVLTSQRVDLKNSESSDIDALLRRNIPLAFSDNQIGAIKNAFGSEISYIQGPPGTGKSYTIGAIVLCSLFLNKKVLVVSQKEPALDVIKEKIERFLTDEGGEDFEAITYYKSSNKSELRANINKIRSHGNNQNKLDYEIEKLEDFIYLDEKWINNQLIEIDKFEIKLKANLEAEHNFKETHNEFLRNRDWFLNQRGLGKELDLGEDYKFKTSGVSLESYNHSLELIDKICDSTPTLITELYKRKFKEHFFKVFSVNTSELHDIYLHQYCKDLIALHSKHVDSHDLRHEIKLDNEQLRNKLDHLKEELGKRQELLIKRSLRFDTLVKLAESRSDDAEDISDNLDKLDKMLYWKKASRIANQMASIDYEKVLDVLPFWLAESRYLGKVLPMKAELFDLVIVDESSQVNLAEILPAFYRGKQIVIVGDHEQLGLDSTGVNFKLSNRFDNLTWEKNFPNSGISFSAATDKKLTVTQCSILDFVRSPYNNVSIRTEMLNEHFRSMPSLAKYTNTNYYEGALRVMTETPDKISKSCFQSIKIDGERDPNSKTILKEAEVITKIVGQLTDRFNNRPLGKNPIKLNLPEFDEKHPSIGVISLMTNQKILIEDLIDEQVPVDYIKKHNIEVWTPQSAQGNERDIIILSICLDENSSGKGNYHKNPRLLNVATSRAKQFSIVVHCDFPLSRYKELGKYLSLTSNSPEWKLDHSAYESEFEKKVYLELKEYVAQRADLRDFRIYNQVETCGQKRIDFVIYDIKNSNAVAIEVDGSYHYKESGITKEYSLEHTDRINILKRAGWKIINTPYYKWYKNGWLCDSNHPTFQKEVQRITDELDYYLMS